MPLMSILCGICRSRSGLAYNVTAFLSINGDTPLNFGTIERTPKLSLAYRLSLSVLLSLAAVTPAWTGALAHDQTKAPSFTADVQREHVTETQVQAAIAEVEKLAQKEIDEKAVAGLAIAVVHKDKVVFAKGFGVREVGKDGKVDPDTVFQIASVSKPVGATVVAMLVDDGKITWDSKISDLDPAFQMYDPWVTREITIRDFYEHRSGLPDHAGDLLEDLGADRSLVLHRLRHQKPDSSFRSSYAYTNFGITEAAQAAAKAYGMSWEDASEQRLYKPLGMNSTSSRYSDFDARTNKAMGHILVNGKLAHTVQRQPDAQSPAGGVSSSVNDMAKWMRLQVANGKFEGKQLVSEKSLTETHHPQMLTQFSPFTKLPGFYGLGMNVSYDELGRLRLGHSGGFAMGAATNVSMVPSEELGIVVLTNTCPIGVAEGLATDFMDLALNGKRTRDWLAVYKKVFADPAVIGVIKGFDYSKPPASPMPAAPNGAYLGPYANDFFGDMAIIEKDGGLAMVLGPLKKNFPIKHYDRDTFTYVSQGENEVGASGVTFTLGADGKATKTVIENLNELGEGTFTRSDSKM
jgi:CubicO group peptidase (beta-lactamase class C family)